MRPTSTLQLQHGDKPSHLHTMPPWRQLDGGLRLCVKGNEPPLLPVCSVHSTCPTNPTIDRRCHNHSPVTALAMLTEAAAAIRSARPLLVAAARSYNQDECASPRGGGGGGSSLNASSGGRGAGGCSRSTRSARGPAFRRVKSPSASSSSASRAHATRAQPP
jgi:hypothetical protein